MMKSILRWVIFHWEVMFGDGEFYAEEGTMKLRFLKWLYEGDCEQTYDRDSMQ